MAVPKRRTSRSRVRSRKAQWKAVSIPTTNECPQCHEQRRPHRACPSCGTYAGREILEVE